MKHSILVIGGGFAGLWAALSAARERAAAAVGSDRLAITLVNRDSWHCIRVRNYERDLSDARLPLAEILGPVDVSLVVATVTAIDVAAHRVEARSENRAIDLSYDHLVLAAGSHLAMPPIPGLAEHSFNVDTFGAGAALNAHIAGLGATAPTSARNTVVVIGAGLTGIEAACEMPDKLKAAGIQRGRVILADSQSHIGSDMGDEARPVIEQALSALGIETRTGIKVTTVEGDAVVLQDGKRIPSKTVVWCAGMRASPLTELLPVERDGLGRVAVDEVLRVKGIDNVYAAGDVAAAIIDEPHLSVMSCQHGRPMGRFAGHNAAADLLGRQLRPLRIGWYVTCLDLGDWGALYTEGWNRHLVAQGSDAKTIKRTINQVRIYPPRPFERQALLDAAAPVVQTPPRDRVRTY